MVRSLTPRRIGRVRSARKPPTAVTPRTRLLVVNTPHNPTGALLTNADWQRVAALVRESGAWLFADEVYRGLELDERDHERQRPARYLRLMGSGMKKWDALRCILIASAIALLTMLYPGSMTPTGGPDFSRAPTLKMLLDIGDAAFKMALPVLAGFISYGMAGKPDSAAVPLLGAHFTSHDENDRS